MEECCQSLSLGNEDYFISFGSKDTNQHVVHYFYGINGEGELARSGFLVSPKPVGILER